MLRIYALSDGELLPLSLKDDLDSLPNFSKWAKTTMAQESVTYIWDQEKVIAGTKRVIAKMKGMK